MQNHLSALLYERDKYAMNLSFCHAPRAGELVYTVEDAVETLGFGLFQVIVTIFSGLLWVCCQW